MDGGLDRLAGRPCAAVIGDMDSLASPVPDGTARIEVSGQDDTDLEKALARVEAPLILGTGFLGGRLDHTLAALHALVADPRPILLLGEEDVALGLGETWRATLVPGDRLSVFPLRDVRAVGSKGLRWELDGLRLRAGERIGTSNEVASAEVAIWMRGRGAVLVLPRPRLDAAMASLLG